MSGAATSPFGLLTGAVRRALRWAVLGCLALSACQPVQAASLVWTNLNILGVTNDATYLFTPTPQPGTSGGALATGGSAAATTTNGIGTVSLLAGRYTVRITGRDPFTIWVPNATGPYNLTQLYRDANGGVVPSDAPFLATTGGELTGNLRFSGVLSGGVIPPHLTTAQRDSLNTVSNGMLIFNVTLGTNQVRGPGGWFNFPGGTDASVFAQLSTVTGIVNAASAATLQSSTNYTDGIVGLYTLLSTFESATNTLTGLINSAGVSADTATNIARAVVAQSNLVNQSQLSTATGAVYAAIPDTSTLATKAALEATNAALVALIDSETAPFINAAQATNIAAYQALIVSNGVTLLIPSTNGLASIPFVTATSNALQSQIGSAGISAETSTNIARAVVGQSNLVTAAQVAAQIASSNLVTASITNDLASIEYARSLTNNFATQAFVASATNTLDGKFANYTTLTLTTNIANAVGQVVSNGLVLLIPSTNGLATLAYVNAATNTVTGLINALSFLSPADSTNAARSVVASSNLVSQSQLSTATNGFVGSGITNNLATISYAQSLTNPLASIYFVQAVSNWVPTQIQSTNGLASTNWVASYNYHAQTNGVLPRWSAATLTLDGEFGINLNSSDGGVSLRADFLSFVGPDGVNLGGPLIVTNAASIQSNLTVGGVIAGNASGLTNVNWPGPGISNVVAGDGILLSTNTGVLVIEATGSGGGSTNGITGTQATNITAALIANSNLVTAAQVASQIASSNLVTAAVTNGLAGLNLVDARTTALSNYVAASALTNANSGLQRLITNNAVKTISAGSNVTIDNQGTNLVITASLAGGSASLGDITNTVNALSVLSSAGTGTSNTFTAPVLINYPHVSTNTYVLSSILGRGDADLSQGSTDYGTLGDVGPQIQSILDQHTNGPVHVVVDGGYSVGQALIVGPFTHIELRLGGGLILRSNVNNSLLKNRSWGLNTTMDEGISITGFGTLNGGGWDGSGNPLQQHSSLSNNWTAIVSFHGVERPFFGKGVQLVNPRTFAVHLGRCNNGTFMSDIDVGPNAVVNQDGYHLNGPSTNNTFADFTVRAFDDGIAINANDGGTNCTTCLNGFGQLSYAGWNGGPIDGVRIRDITFKNSAFGVRILSADELAENINIDGLYGNTTAHAILMDNYAEDLNDLNGVGWGNVGSVRIRNVQTKVAYRNYYTATIYINCRYRQLSIGDGFSNFLEPVTGIYPYLFVNSNGFGNQLSINGMDFVTTTNEAKLENVIILGGDTKLVSVTDNKFYRTNGTSLYPINISANIGSLVAHGNQAWGYRSLFSAINPDFDNIITNAELSGNYVLPGVYLDTGATNLGNGVYRFSAAAGFVTIEKETSNLGGDVSQGVDFFVEGPSGTNGTVMLSSRSQNGVPWFNETRRRNYAFGLNVNGAGTESMVITAKATPATDYVLASSGSFEYTFDSGWYRLEMDTIDERDNQALIAGRVFRYSDSKWLQSNFVWSATKADAIRTRATGTNYWNPSIALTAWGYNSRFATNATLLTSNYTVQAISTIVDSVPNLAGPRINIGGGAPSVAAYSANAETIAVKGSGGDRTSMQIVAPTNTIQVVVQAVEPTPSVGAAGYIGTSTAHPLKLFANDTLGLELSGTDGIPQASIFRLFGPNSQFIIADRAGNGISNAVYTTGGSLVIYNNWLNGIAAEFRTNGNFLSLSNVTSVNGQFIGHGGGITNAPYQAPSAVLTNLAANAANTVTNVSPVRGVAASISSGTLTIGMTNRHTLIASNANQVAIDFSNSGTIDYFVADMQTNTTLRLTNAVVGNSVNVYIGSSSGLWWDVAVATNNTSGKIRWNLNSPTNTLNGYRVTNGVMNHLYLKVLPDNSIDAKLGVSR